MSQHMQKPNLQCSLDSYRNTNINREHVVLFDIYNLKYIFIIDILSTNYFYFICIWPIHVELWQYINLLNSNTIDGFKDPLKGSLNPSAVLEFSKM